jgi:SET domain-containing protein
MKPTLIQNNLVVKKSAIDGYGVFAKKNMLEGEILEECYCILYECKARCIPNYHFKIVRNQITEAVLPTGFGCLYNHSSTPNADYEIDQVNNILTIEATKPIAEGEEIFISYGNNWFSERNIKVKKAPLWFRLRKPLVILLKLFCVAGIYLSLTLLVNHFK